MYEKIHCICKYNQILKIYIHIIIYDSVNTNVYLINQNNLPILEYKTL